MTQSSSQIERREALAETVHLLERLREQGRQRIYVAPENWAALGKGVPVADTSSPPLSTDTPVPDGAQPSPHPRNVAPHKTPGTSMPSTPPSPPDTASPAPSTETSDAPIEQMSWDALAGAVRECTRCGLCQTRTNTVFGEGAPDAELMFIGEGPGADEDAQGRPFVGRAGQLLTKMIHAMQYTREQVFIGNIVKCRPPGNRKPEEGEAAACLPYLRRQIACIRPKVIVVLGNTPLFHLLGKTGITRQRGQWHEFEGVPVMPTFHPSFLLRSPGKKRPVWDDLQQVMRALGNDPAQTPRQT